jgi:cytochrome c oxidase cbb3-type subunit 3
MLTRYCLFALGTLAFAHGACAAQDEVPAATFPAEQIEAGRVRFTADCGFCHGRDAQGGSRGLDLTRSELVAQDSSGALISEVVLRGRVDKGMPAFATLSQADLAAIAAYIHTQKSIAESAEGGRRSVEPADLMTGDAARGQMYFAANCSACHDPAGDLAGIASRQQGLQLFMRMLNPRSGNNTSPRATPMLHVTTPGGETLSGALAYRDEFTVALRDANGAYRSWSTRELTYSVDDPLAEHVAQLSRYTDADMHDVLAYLFTLQ